MQLKTIKNAADLPFSGIELIRIDKAIREVVIGGKLRIKVANTYSSDLELLVAAPYEPATRYRVTGTLDGFDPKISYFETEYEAKSAVTDFESKGATATLEKVDVLIDEAGAVVPAANDDEPAPPATPARILEDLPF